MNVAIEDNRKILRLSNSTTEMRFHAIWLRDNALDPETRDPVTNHRMIRFKDLPEDLQISTAEIQKDELFCTFTPGGKAARFPLHWLTSHCYDKPILKRRVSEDLITWDGSLSKVPETDITVLRSDQGALRSWLTQVATLGFAKVTGLNASPDALYDIVDLFGYVRETEFGRLSEVRIETNPTNLTFTNEPAYPHTDNPYRIPTPSLQVFSCIENSAEGGDSYVVDGFAAALRLEQESHEHFDLLSRHMARFVFTGNSGKHLKSRRPIIELSPDDQLQHIRVNYFCLAPLTDIPFDEMEAYYAAHRHFSSIIDDPAMAVTFKLAPGEGYIVDNTRVLHARKSFSGSGHRWLQSCYSEKDGLPGTLAALNSEVH
ncbi:MAG: 2-trimethylaminoethylphosphonate dioxygenase [Pseudomonadales bacterium]